MSVLQPIKRFFRRLGYLLLATPWAVVLGLIEILRSERGRRLLASLSLLGLLAAARRGWVEEAVMRLADFGLAFPALLTAIMLGAVYGPGLTTAIVAIGLFNIPEFARITRASANTVWSREFVLAVTAQFGS